MYDTLVVLVHKRDAASSVSSGLSGGGGSEVCWADVSWYSSSDSVSDDGSFSQRVVIEGNCEVDPVRVACVEVEGESPSSSLAFAISR